MSEELESDGVGDGRVLRYECLETIGGGAMAALGRTCDADVSATIGAIGAVLLESSTILGW